MWDMTLRSLAARACASTNKQQTAELALRSSVLPVAIVAVAAAAMAGTASAETFDEAFTREARRLCAQGALPSPIPGAAPIPIPCGPFTDDRFGVPTGIGGFTAPTAALAIEERLRTARQAEGGGASSDEVVSLGNGISVFASAGAESLTHFNNKYEDGYQSTIPTVTVGADYQVTPWLVAGLAFNYFNFNGDYDDGGHFNTNSFGPIAYASFLPFDGAFADVTLGYARKDYFRDRNGVIRCDCGDLPGHQSGGTDGNEYTASLLLGYDYPIENFTVGPRLGLNYIATQIYDYKEHGNNGLSLRYSGQDESTLQSSLGVFATMAISTDFGVLLPQASASWVHDYAVGGRTIDAGFVNATVPSEFSFKRERVASNFANIGAGISALLPNRWEPFVNFRTTQGNKNLVNYGGAAGLRVGL
jgi:outer membrane autotransporter protein